MTQRTTQRSSEHVPERTSPGSIPRFDVIVVGLGPTGAVLTHLLARAGVRTCVFERDPEVYPRPRAVFFDDEIMRVLAGLGLADEVHGFSRPVQGMDLINGEGELLYRYRPHQAESELGFAEGYMFSQPDLETSLRRALIGAEGIDLVLGADVESIERVGPEPPEYVVTALGPDGARITAQAPWVIGCDGARSKVRAHMRTELQSLGPDAEWLVVDLRLEPGRTAWHDLPEVTVQYCDPRRPATFVPLPGHRVRFEIRVLPDDDRERLVRPDRLRELLRTWMPSDDYAIERAVVYTFHALLADRWRHGGLFIAGDAAHQMPPFLGQGLCSGIRDAANLAWKLARVIRGRAADALLDTYESERSPQTRAVIGVDLELGELIQTTDPERAALRDEHARRAGGAVAISPPRIPIGPGVRADAEPAGLPAPHLDAGWGGGDPLALTLFGRVAAHPENSADLDARLEALGVARVEHASPGLEAWLESLEATAVLVRPDGLVATVVRASHDLEAWLAAQQSVLALPPPDAQLPEAP